MEGEYIPPDYRSKAITFYTPGLRFREPWLHANSEGFTCLNEPGMRVNTETEDPRISAALKRTVWAEWNDVQRAYEYKSNSSRRAPKEAMESWTSLTLDMGSEEPNTCTSTLIEEAGGLDASLAPIGGCGGAVTDTEGAEPPIWPDRMTFLRMFQGRDHVRSKILGDLQSNVIETTVELETVFVRLMQLFGEISAPMNGEEEMDYNIALHFETHSLTHFTKAYVFEHRNLFPLLHENYVKYDEDYGQDQFLNMYMKAIKKNVGTKPEFIPGPV